MTRQNQTLSESMRPTIRTEECVCVCVRERFSHSQSAHEFRGILVPGVTRVCGVTTPRLHHQPVLDINVQGVFRHHLQNESILVRHSSALHEI